MMNIKITIRALQEDLEAAADAIRAISENVTYESGVQYTRHGVFVRKNFTVDRLRVKGQGSEENKSLLSAATVAGNEVSCMNTGTSFTDQEINRLMACAKTDAGACELMEDVIKKLSELDSVTMEQDSKAVIKIYMTALLHIIECVRGDRSALFESLQARNL